MAKEYVEATLTSSRTNLELQLNCREIILNNQLNIAGEKPYNQGQTEETTSQKDW